MDIYMDIYIYIITKEEREREDLVLELGELFHVVSTNDVWPICQHLPHLTRGGESFLLTTDSSESDNFIRPALRHADRETLFRCRAKLILSPAEREGKGLFLNPQTRPCHANKGNQTTREFTSP